MNIVYSCMNQSDIADALIALISEKASCACLLFPASLIFSLSLVLVPPLIYLFFIPEGSLFLKLKN